MFHKRSVTLWVVLGLMAILATSAGASAPPPNILTSATATANCQGYNLTLSAKDLQVGKAYTINYNFTLTCNGVATQVPGSVTFTATGTTQTVTAKGTFPGLSGKCVVTGTATLAKSTVAIVINGKTSAALTCGVITSNCVVINATQNVPIKPVTLTASGGDGGPYTFTASGLPSGLSISTGGIISGTPTVSGTFSYTVTITDGEGNTGTLNCSLTVNPPLQVTCQAVNVGDVGVPFNSGPMKVTGGTRPYTFSIGSGTLPAGLTLNTSTGAVIGTPTAPGTFSVKVTDANGAVGTSCTITINPALSVTCQANNTGEVGVSFNSGPMNVTGGTPPYMYSIVGTLPPGLTLNTSTGAVTGTPTAAGTFTVKVTDAAGSSSTSCTITINGPLSVTCAAVNTGDVGVPFSSGPMTVTGGTAPYTFSIVGTLPPGLTLNTSTGAVTGTPTAAGTFTVKVTDAVGNSSTSCLITINGPLQVTCQAVNTGDVGVPFNSGPMTVTGGTAPYTFSIVGTLPPGLTLNTSTGAVTGTPTAAGTFTVEVTDAVGNVGTGCMITINATPPCGASGLNLGTDSNYIFIDTGATKLGWNAYQLDGNVLFGQGLTVALSGGNNGGLGAGYKVYEDSTTNISGSLQNPLTFVSVPTSQTAAAAATAQSVSNYASGLTATQTFTTINNTATINGNGGLNVISVGKIQNATLTINGSANDYFVFNVSGQIQTNQVMTLTGGVTASHILWNLTGTGTVLQTSGGNLLVGTFLATRGGQFQFSELQLTGELINTGGNIQLVSGNHTLIQAGFMPPPSVGYLPNTATVGATNVTGTVSATANITIKN